MARRYGDYGDTLEAVETIYLDQVDEAVYNDDKRAASAGLKQMLSIYNEAKKQFRDMAYFEKMEEMVQDATNAIRRM